MDWDLVPAAVFPPAVLGDLIRDEEALLAIFVGATRHLVKDRIVHDERGRRVVARKDKVDNSVASRRVVRPTDRVDDVVDASRGRRWRQLGAGWVRRRRWRR